MLLDAQNTICIVKQVDIVRMQMEGIWAIVQHVNSQGNQLLGARVLRAPNFKHQGIAEHLITK